jgi:NADH dehydrogenase
MLLLTGATGLVGSAVLTRLLGDGVAVRCLVRDPRRLGAQRVRVQIALGDLTDPPSFRNALRGVDTVVHLAASIRDQPHGSIEELDGIATWRMVESAQRAGVEHFVFFSVLGASTHHRARFFRAKALAEQAVRETEMRSTVFAPSIVYAPGDRWLTLLERLALLPLVPISGRGRAVYQPIWAEDVADCVMAALGGAARGNGQPAPRVSAQRGEAPGERPAPDGAIRERADFHERLELAGPDTLTYNDIVHLVLRSLGRRRALLHVPTPAVSRALRLLEATVGTRAFATWDEAELMEVSMTSSRGVADAARLGVTPKPMRAILAPAAGL